MNDYDPELAKKVRDAMPKGLYAKFQVERTDGRSAPGEKHDGCEYFVLDLTHDPHAIPALKAYEASLRRDTGHDWTQLAHDLRMTWLRLQRPPDGEPEPSGERET